MIHPQARPDAVLIDRRGSFPVTSLRATAVGSRALVLAAALATAAGTSFGCSSSDNPVAPSGSAIATVRVVNEAYRILLTTPAQIEAARAAQAGGRASIPNGRLVTGAQVNSGYTWHVEDVEFAESTIEVCDGLPSLVQREGVNFGGGRYCPWSAQVVSVEMVE